MRLEKYQPVDIFTAKFAVPVANVGAIIPWLSVLDEQWASDGVSAPILVSGEEGKFWLEQVLLLTSRLLHVVRAPVFNRIEIVQCHRSTLSDEHWEASCRLPDPNLVTPAIFQRLCQLAFKLGRWMATADVASTADRNRLFAVIEREVLQVIPGALSNGKSTFHVVRSAHNLGIPYRALPGGVFQLGWGAHARYVDRSSTDGDSGMGMRWSRSKLLGAQILRRGALPAPTHFAVSSYKEAEVVAEQLGYPVVVKPVDCERGEGVSVDVDKESLQAAFTLAFDLSPSKTVLVERQVGGVCHRLFVASGKLLYVSKRQPLGVYGNGAATIRELVAAEYEAQQSKPPWSRTKIKPLDDMALGELRRQGWDPDQVPPADRFIALRRIESTALGGSAQDVTDFVHPENARLAVATAELFGLDVAGVDLMTEDIAQPWHANGAVITEVNFSPLLGGRVSLQYIGEYLSRVLKDGGRIPLYAYQGGPSCGDRAERHWRELRANGIAAFLVSDKEVIDHKAEIYAMAAANLADRVDALLMNREVGAIVIYSTLQGDHKWFEPLGLTPIR